GLAELLARVKAVLRRDAIARSRTRPVLRTASFEIDEDTRAVRRDGDSVGLTATELDVLMTLASARGPVRSREQIPEAGWGPGHDATRRTLDNWLLQLRHRRGPGPSRPRHLVRVRGVGYRFGAD